MVAVLDPEAGHEQAVLLRRRLAAYVVSGVIAPEPSAAIEVTILNTEPGHVAALDRTIEEWLAGSEMTALNAARAVAGLAMALALYVGVEAIARTWPVRGSSMTTRPASSPSCRTASFWRSSDRLRVRFCGR